MRFTIHNRPFPQQLFASLVALSASSILLHTGASSLFSADGPLYNRDVRPILSESCFRCHGPDANQRKADLRLDDAESATAAAIVVGEPDQSELIARITSDDPELRMPPPESGKPLSREEVDVLKRWIAGGAAYEKHWSFIAPQRPTTPSSMERADWPRGPIDEFVLAKMLQQKLTPSPEADRFTWLRRVSLDLIGLPPSPVEIRNFVNDRSPDAYERVVDRLLNSKQYGEHMARYWLDAARYADTNGYQYDLEREQWVWRDWVIHAFNTNMPFDKFTVQQIAGDLLPNATDQQKLATAFHRNHPITIEGGVIDEEYRTEYVVDRLVTTSTVWLGLTMLCGRCHDHKYDPIEQREFYQLFAFFNQVPERGLNGFNPKLKVASPLAATATESAKREIDLLTRRLRSMRSEREVEFRNWQRTAAEANRDPWKMVVPSQRQSQGGAQLVVQSDQSVLATGKNPALERYDLTLTLSGPVHAIRVEALTDPSLANGSVGRASNGNFVLSEFELSAADGPTGKFRSWKIAKAEADYSQANYSVNMAIDGKIDRSGWAVDGNTRFKSSTAVFHLAEPLQLKAGGRLRIQLHHGWGSSHSIGRFRLAVAERPVGAANAQLRALLATPRKKRSPEQTDQLARIFLSREGGVAGQTIHRRLTQLEAIRDSVASVPATMVMAELAKPRPTHVLYRGEYDKPGEEVAANVPAALPPLPSGAPQNRLGLAQWMVMPDNPLTARVTVNRFWERVFGRGIVKTTEDFGSQGAWPSHPELLDWLAVDFVESGWDVQRLLKQLVLSATYRQSSALDARRLLADPENVWLARGPRNRLDAEVIRDSALAAGGLLNRHLGGPSVFPYHPSGLWQEINNRPGYSRVYKQDKGEKLYRRSLYTFWKRTVPPPSMAAFDAPEREFCVVRRSRTNTPLQSLVMLHDPQFVEAARHVAGQVLRRDGRSVRDRIHHAYLLCLCRPPTDDELRLIEAMLQRRLKLYRGDASAAERVLSVGDSAVNEDLDAAELAAWTTVCRALLNLSEFVTRS